MVFCFKNSGIYGILVNQFFAMVTMLPLELLQILACPVCKGELLRSENGPALHCKQCGREYPVVEGIPVLLPDQTVTTS